MSRSEQLANLCALHGIREQAALLEMQKHQRSVAALDTKLNEIKTCIDNYQRQILELNEARSNSTYLTVATLQEEAKHRAILERDLRKELFYLDTALEDLANATAELSEKRALWHKQHNRSDALVKVACG